MPEYSIKDLQNRTDTTPVRTYTVTADSGEQAVTEAAFQSKSHELLIVSDPVTNLSGPAFLQAMAIDALEEVRIAVDLLASDYVLEVRLNAAREAMVATGQKLAGLCNTEAAAVAANADVALFESGLVGASISPATVRTPAKYRR